MLHKQGILIIPCMLLLSACVKPPEYPVVPYIEVVGINKNEFVELDPVNLVVTIYFEDGDGDLGSEDQVNMFWEDSRVPGFEIPFKIPTIEGQGNVKAISGTVSTEYPITFCIDDSDPIDSFYYKIYIVDQAGHISNVDSTEMIQLHCD